MGWVGITSHLLAVVLTPIGGFKTAGLVITKVFIWCMKHLSVALDDGAACSFLYIFLTPVIKDVYATISFLLNFTFLKIKIFLWLPFNIYVQNLYSLAITAVVCLCYR